MLLPGIHWQWLRVCFIGVILFFSVSHVIKKLFFDENVD
jgi:hypothetical protein